MDVRDVNEPHERLIMIAYNNKLYQTYISFFM